MTRTDRNVVHGRAIVKKQTDYYSLRSLEPIPAQYIGSYEALMYGQLVVVRRYTYNDSEAQTRVRDNINTKKTDQNSRDSISPQAEDNV